MGASSRGTLLLAASLLTSVRWAGAQNIGPLKPVDPAPFAALIHERFRALVAGDSAGFHRLVADEAHGWGDDGIPAGLSTTLPRVAAGAWKGIDFQIADVEVARSGALALAGFWLLYDFPVRPDSTVHFRNRVSIIFVQRAGRWLQLQYTESHNPRLPPPIHLDSLALSEFVGDYEWWPGYVDRVTQRGDSLFQQATDESEPTPLLASSPETFYTVGDPGMVVFVRDKSGRVTHYALHWVDGQVTLARRVH